MTRPRFRIALAGLGAAAREIHLPALRGLPEVAVVGGCDPAPKLARVPFPLFATVEEMLERTRPDILAVLTPPDTHHALTLQGLRAGCHVVCEKPFTVTLDEAAEVCQAARAAGRHVVVNNQYRFMNVHREAKRRIGTPAFGELLFLSAQQSFFTSAASEAGWRGRDPERTCKEFGTHVLDLCRFFFGEDPIMLTAQMPKPGARDGPDYLDLISLEFSGGRAAHVLLDRLSRGPHRYLTLRLDGSAGCIETRLGGGLELHAGVRGGSRRPYLELDLSWGGRARLYHGERFVKIAADPPEPFAAATRRLVRALLEALAQGTTPPCDAEDNRRTLALMRAAYASAASGTPVRPSC